MPGKSGETTQARQPARAALALRVLWTLGLTGLAAFVVHVTLDIGA